VSVAVVIPVRDGERYLAEALESVIEQTLPPSEIVLVDGGSRDGTLEVAARYPQVRVLVRDGVALADQINAGFAATTAPLIALQADDDIWLPQKLERQVELLERTGAEAVVGMAEFFLEPDEGPPSGLREEVLEAPRVVRLPETLLVRRTLLERVGGWRREAAHAADVDWFARVHDAGVEVPAVEEVILRKRIRGSSTTHTSPAAMTGTFVALRASIARKRAMRS
jgi:glycosyltransferase involved in cell wall biosynthesis